MPHLQFIRALLPHLQLIAAEEQLMQVGELGHVGWERLEIVARKAQHLESKEEMRLG